MDTGKAQKDVVRLATWMTKAPRTIEPHQTLQQAQDIMQHGHFRHLPVCSGGKVVGVLSRRDLEYTLGANPSAGAQTQILQVMSPEPQIAREDQAIKEVLTMMQTDRIGSVVVTDSQGRVTGIFTESDAMRLLREIL